MTHHPNVTVALIVMTGLLLPASAQEPANEQRPFACIAHRGASGYLPEHTLEATAMAHAMGADFIEQDVVLTKDDQAIVLHDIHLDTVTDVASQFPDRMRDDGRFYAIDFTLKEIKRLRVHERINHESGKPVFPDRFPVQHAIFRIPTLTEAITAIQGMNHSTGREVGIYPEIKKPKWHRQQGKEISQTVLAILHELGYRTATDNIFLQCFDPVELRAIREKMGCQLKLVQLIGSNDWKESDVDYNTLVTAEGLKTIAEYADGIGPWMPFVVKDMSHEQKSDKPFHPTNLVDLAHQNRLVVHPFTFRADSLPDYAQNFAQLVTIFRDIGVDGIFTDQTDQAVQVAAPSSSQQAQPPQ